MTASSVGQPQAVRNRLPRASCSLTSCSVGPHYNRPLTPMTPAFKELPPGNDHWKASTPRDGEIKGKWWEMFNDPQLNSIEEQVAINNQNVKQAEATFRGAQALVAANRANYYPTIGVTPVITTTGTGSARDRHLRRHSLIGNISTLFNIPFSASWVPDFWGRVRLCRGKCHRTGTGVGRRSGERPSALIKRKWPAIITSCSPPTCRKSCWTTP